MRSNYLFTSESVSEGHPDKVADQISDAVVDLFLSKDPEARVACETLVTTQRIVIGGEIRCKGVYDEELFADTHGWAPGARDEIEQVVRQTVRAIGYEQDGFHWQTADFENHLHGQSAHIAQGVDAAGHKDEGAGDQGLMFGYACTETPELMPMPIMLAHKLVKGLSERRRDSSMDYLRPDGKSQVSIEYDNGRPVRVDTIVVSTQHSPTVTNETLREDITEKIVHKVIPKEMMDAKTRILINPTGRFVVGGPHG
ncbi:S-adenosylmethionine synthetase N-terminal domain-containing protein, partial [Allosphingosinicella sp.]|uniref:S-adenosylmethionine synthetase N-terminal domain-containing protein n=1 Tax=Allosphingosinicella sp. TaxID=2823234 RepID=UPI002EEF4C1C